ncbi:MAG: tripartite tricarboxylate transporter substrate binding protein [Burkholderiales bacterium]|nr:tripartite tricarboxylate transporter substrate binding protein [Burkholderiales bacterium]
MNEARFTAPAFAACLAVLALAPLRVPAQEAAWRPEKSVELIVPTAPGSNNDAMVRLVQRVLQERRLVTAPVLTVNKPGGNQYLAVVYLTQHDADPHYVLMTNPSIITNELNGLAKQPYARMTPLALMVVESNAFTVRADSPMKDMRDLMARLKADPESVTFAMPSRGGVPHLALAAAVRAAGLDPKKLKIVVFKASAESITGLLGGHIDVMVSSLASVMGIKQAGKGRVLAIAARQRRPGAAADVPTLREQGLATDGVAAWRGLSGPPGLTVPQVAFWDATLEKVFSSEEWKSYLAKNELPPQYRKSGEFAAYLKGEYETIKALLSDLGLTK